MMRPSYRGIADQHMFVGGNEAPTSSLVTPCFAQRRGGLRRAVIPETRCRDEYSDVQPRLADRCLSRWHRLQRAGPAVMRKSSWIVW